MISKGMFTVCWHLPEGWIRPHNQFTCILEQTLWAIGTPV
jgi:hypothetical protein